MWYCLLTYFYVQIDLYVYEPAIGFFALGQQGDFAPDRGTLNPKTLRMEEWMMVDLQYW